LLVQGDAVLLRQLFNNLISNAVRYCLPGAWIRISAHARAMGIEVVFSNAAQTIALGDRARFFDRFYRGDAAHNRHIDGSGLGLSLAREIARAHGGDLVLAATALDVVALQLTLPRR
jgi:signal transduction histidine kinase